MQNVKISKLTSLKRPPARGKTATTGCSSREFPTWYHHRLVATNSNTQDPTCKPKEEEKEKNADSDSTGSNTTYASNSNNMNTTHCRPTNQNPANTNHNGITETDQADTINADHIDTNVIMILITINPFSSDPTASNTNQAVDTTNNSDGNDEANSTVTMITSNPDISDSNDTNTSIDNHNDHKRGDNDDDDNTPLSKLSGSGKSQDDEERYYVEAIIKKKIVNKKTFCKVKWKGYPSERNTWEPHSAVLWSACHLTALSWKSWFFVLKSSGWLTII